MIFAYKPTNEDELDLKDGDVITILSKDLPDKGWWKGELKGKVGVFPDNFVQLISPDCEHDRNSMSKLRKLIYYLFCSVANERQHINAG